MKQTTYKFSELSEQAKAYAIDQEKRNIIKSMIAKYFLPSVIESLNTGEKKIDINNEISYIRSPIDINKTLKLATTIFPESACEIYCINKNKNFKYIVNHFKFTIELNLPYAFNREENKDKRGGIACTFKNMDKKVLDKETNKEILALIEHLYMFIVKVKDYICEQSIFQKLDEVTYLISAKQIIKTLSSPEYKFTSDGKMI